MIEEVKVGKIWKEGRMEDWKIGMLEDWKFGKMEE